MKGLKVLIVAGLFVILTSIICFGDRDVVYKKQIHFNSPEEIIEVLNNKVLSAYEENNIGYSSPVITDDFKECLSRRKRITDSLVMFQRLNLKVEEEYDEDSIINNYKAASNCLLDYKVGDNLKAYSLKGTYDNVHQGKGNIKMDIVFVDEGEGYVIDYMMCSYDDTERINIE